MKTGHVNHLNTGLMLASLAAACALPFEVFLVFYAVLGPLHYLTEISWLRDRRWFSARQTDWLPLIGLAILMVLGSRYVLGDSGQAILERVGVASFLQRWHGDWVFLAFGVALLFVVSNSNRVRAVGALVLFASVPLLRDTSVYTRVFVVYLSTIIHVFVFTGMFILWGALKAKSPSGYLSFAIFLSCALACFLVPASTGYEVTAWARGNFDEPFRGLTQFLLIDLQGVPIGEVTRVDLFSSPASQLVVRFVAFAYTYHYLNWFSKTSVIRWHQVPPARFVVVFVVWAASIGLYLYDYALGFRWLFLLSFAHVVLEFPLNHRSLAGILGELRLRVRT